VESPPDSLFVEVASRLGLILASGHAGICSHHAELPRGVAMHTKRQVLFVQGGGDGVHDDWDGKLVASLSSELGRNYEIRYPRMPREGEPTYCAWRAALEKELAGLNDGAILVGHSLGGTILVHALAEHLPERGIGAILLISAPFVGEGGWRIDGWESQRELGARLPDGVPIYLYHGLADETVPPSHAQLFAHAIPKAHLCHLPDRDHQLNNDLSEIAAVIKSMAVDPVR
jgi:predicted alpha/beta hydrolase family esterase